MVDPVDLRRLQVLRMVHEYGTVTAAAEALHLTPSAVSHQIRQLSRELGVALLEPNGRRVRLTSAAHILVGHADALHARWEQAQADLDAHGDGSAGLLRLCGFPSAVSALLAPAARLLQTTCPRLTVHIAEVENAEGFELLLSGDADIAVVVPTPDSPPLDDPKFDQQPLLEEPLDLLVPPDHPFADRDAVGLAEAAHEQWIVAAPGSTSDSYQVTMVACAAAGFTPRIAHSACDAVPGLVACGLGVAFASRLREIPPHSGVRVPLTGEARPTRRLLTCVRRGGRDHPAIARGLAAVQAAADDFRASPMNGPFIRI